MFNGAWSQIRRALPIRDPDRQGSNRLFALFAITLLVLSLVATPLAAQPPRDSSELNPDSQAVDDGATPLLSTAIDESVVPQRAPHSLFVSARATVDTLEFTHRGQQSHLGRAKSQYSDAIDGFESPATADVGSLNAAAQATRALRALVASSNGNRALNDSQKATIRTASQTTVAATSVTAHWRLDAAERTLARHEDNLSKGQQRSLEANIENARRAYDRAEQTLGSVDADTKLRKTLGQRASAITQYRVGYRQATQVLDRLDRLGVGSSGTDTDGDGVLDDREAELGTNASRADTDGDGIDDGVETAGGFPIDTDDDLTIDALDGDSDADRLPDYVEGTSDTDGDGIENFRDVDDDGDTIPTRTEVEDGRQLFPDYDYDDQPNWLDTDADGDGLGDAVEGTVDVDDDTVPAYLDNDRDEDGLPDFYETNVTHTNPEDNDSDSSVTNAEEAGNGVIDGMEDADGDSLGAFREYTFGTDPFDADTDDDGLSDWFEQRTEGLDPLVADTDGDGVLDGAEDPDDDGLNNSAEEAAHSSLRVADTDSDGIHDGPEVENGTNPVLVDSDDDGLTDTEEPMLGTDPTDPDTDDDGILDGDETFERTVTDETMGVAVDLRGQGALEADITPKPSFFTGTNATAGPTFRIQNRTDFENATVRIDIDESVPESDYENLSVYKWNGSAEDRWHRVNTTIENGTALATVSSFSFFTVLDTDEWTGYVDLGPGGGNASPLGFADLPNFQCTNACNVTNETTLVLGGEPSARKITIEQAGETFEVVPLSNGQTIEQFYNYGDSEINSPLPVAKSDVSRMFFWAGPEGLSLVFIHDKPRDGSGAAVSMDFDNLPGEGYWVVRDDSGDFGYYGTSPDWSWNRDNTDGGAFRGGLTNTSVTITPYFNDAAARYPLEPGTIDQWQVATGRATDPRNISLDMNQPVTLHVPDAPETSTGGDDDTSDRGTATFTHTVAAETQGLTVAYQTEQTDVDPVATLTATDEDGTTVTKQLTIGTVGTVQETVNVSGLRGDVDFTVNVSGVNARVQIVPEQARRDTDGDGLSDAHELQTWTMSNGPGDTFTTSPYVADTDGDGLNDSEEVTFAPQGEGEDIRYVAKTTSNPAKYDTDGDGISDAVELAGWETTIANDPGVAKDYLEAVRNDDPGAEGLLHSISVGSSPLLTDTDGDGLSDGTEKSLGLAPSDADTDGDTISDAEEYSNQWYARLHDFRPPRTSGWVDTDGDREQYRVTITLHDQSGVGTVDVYKGGKRASQDYYGREHVFEDQIEFTIDRDAVDQIGTALSGYVTPSTVKVVARDMHETRVERKFYGPNNFGKIAEGIAQTSFPFGGVGTWVQTSSVAFFGEVSGASQSVNVFATDLTRTAYVATHPKKYDDAARQTAQSLGHLKDIALQSEKRHQALTAIVQYYGDRRQQLNPFEDGGKYQEAFAIGYSVGYAGSFLVPVYAEAKAAQAAVRLPYVATLVRSAGTVKASIKGAAIGSAMWTGGRIANRLPDVNFRVGKRIDDVELGDRAKSVVGQTADTLRRTPLPEQRRILRLTDDAKGREVFDWLTSKPDSDRYAKGLTYLRRTGETGKDLLSKLQPEPRQYLLDLRDKAALQRQLTEAYAKGDADFGDIGRTVKRYDSLGSSGKAAFRDIVETEGPDAVAAAGRIDAVSFTSVMESDLPVETKARAFDALDDADDIEGVRRFLDVTDEDGVEFLAEMGERDVRGLFSSGCSPARFSATGVSSQGDVDLQTVLPECLTVGDLSDEKMRTLAGEQDVVDFVSTSESHGLELLEALDENQIRRLLDGDYDFETFGREFGELKQSKRDLLTESLAEGDIDIDANAGGFQELVTEADELQTSRVEDLVDDFRAFDDDTDEAALELLDRTAGSNAGQHLLDTLGRNEVRRFLQLEVDGVDMDGVRARLAYSLQSEGFDATDISRFTDSVETLEGVDGLAEGLNKIDGAERSNSAFNVIKGTEYELDIAAHSDAFDIGDIDQLEWNEQTLRYDDLDSATIESLKDDVAFPDATNDEQKEQIIEEAMNPSEKTGLNDKDTELDIVLKNGDYYEAKNKRTLDWEDLQKKVIRYRAHQLEGDIPADGTMYIDSKLDSAYTAGVDELVDGTSLLKKVTDESESTLLGATGDSTHWKDLLLKMHRRAGSDQRTLSVSDSTPDESLTDGLLRDSRSRCVVSP
ncbi:hypothetical protein [Haloarchaeobius sp. DFWS5]|uniref:hypothetical protein n=1 Tax=Haloarchaeobius sp. DFWS5 TaxID=3446114 RepID=UPI003EBCA05B